MGAGIHFNCDDGGFLPDAYSHFIGRKGPLINEHIKGPLAAVIRSLLIKVLDRNVETLAL